MPNYKYTAMNVQGRTVRGNLTADNDIDLEARLKDIDLDLIDFKEAKEKRAGIGAKISQRDMIMMLVHLEQLSRANVMIYDALLDVRDSTESLKLREVVTDLCENIKGGMPLSDAMAMHDKVFGNVMVGLVKAGEKEGDFSESFGHMTEHMKWTSELKRRVRKAITYPSMLLVVMTLVIVILMVAVVPQLVDFMTSQGFDLPIHTRALIATSEFVQNYWWVILGFPVFALISFKLCYRFIPGADYALDAVMLKLPIIGTTVRKVNMARFTHFFGVLFRSGIDIPDALDSARDVVNNRVLKQSIDVVIRSVTEGGNNLSASLRLSGEFPNLVVRMFKVGEDSGKMNEALDNISYFYGREVNDAVDALVGSIQPMLTAVMGLIIFWIIASIFGPLYQSFQNLNF